MNEKPLQQLKDGTAIQIIWNTEDVLRVAPHLTKDEAIHVLEYLLDEHDANIGINWDVISSAVSCLYPEEQE